MTLTVDVKGDVVALKRKRILDAATHLFLAAGYHGTSMDAIAKSIGVTKPFIYYQFADKGDILAHVSSRGAELTLLALDEAESHERSHSETMRWFCRRLAEVVIDHGGYLAVYLRETSNLRPRDRKAILRLRADIDRRVTRLIEAGVASGDFDVADARISASAITVMISYSFQWHRASDPPGRDEFARILADVAMRTLRGGAH